MLIGKDGDNPSVGLDVGRDEGVADAISNGGLAVDEDRHIGTQPGPESREIVIGVAQVLQLVEHAEHQSGVRAATAESGAHGNGFAELNADVQLLSGICAQQLQRFEDEIGVVDGHIRPIASEMGLRSRRDFELVVPIDEHKTGLDIVIAVIPTPYYTETEVEFGVGFGDEHREE